MKLYETRTKKYTFSNRKSGFSEVLKIKKKINPMPSTLGFGDETRESPKSGHAESGEGILSISSENSDLNRKLVFVQI